MVDSRLSEAIDDLDRRLREQERLQLGRLNEDLIEALGALRTRIVSVEDTVGDLNAVPYTPPGVFEQFRTGHAGVVLGYRDGGEATNATYVQFEDIFRGPEERVRQRQQIFAELLAHHEPVLDAGCGRGEFLDLMRERDVSCVGVDIDDGMAEHSREKGHDVHCGDVNQYLADLDDETLGSIFSAQVVEHIPYEALLRFFELSLAKLKRGGLFVAETVNPHATHALKTFWVDPTHQHPLFPEVLLALCKLIGFRTAYAWHPLGTGHVDDDRYRESAYAVVARKP